MRVVGIGVVAAAVVIGAWWGRPVPPPPASSSPLLSPVREPSSSITVHVAGWVARPGLVAVPEGARVADAIEAAGGAISGARLDVINLAQTVQDGERVDVPGPQDTASVAEAASDGRVAINRATASELESLPGIGPVLAERIVAYRDEHGPFSAVEDLLSVSGIGERKLDSLRDYIRVP